jgi:hypothetical protein
VQHDRPQHHAVQCEQGVVTDKQAGAVGDIVGIHQHGVEQEFRHPVGKILPGRGGRLDGQSHFDVPGQALFVVGAVVLVEYAHVQPCSRLCLILAMELSRISSLLAA